jgi:hypothetical protein
MPSPNFTWSPGFTASRSGLAAAPLSVRNNGVEHDVQACAAAFATPAASSESPTLLNRTSVEVSMHAVLSTL